MSLITNERVADLVIAFLATGKGPTFNDPDDAEKAGQWLGTVFNTLKKTINDEQGK
jgi:hypothetical protein